VQSFLDAWPQASCHSGKALMDPSWEHHVGYVFAVDIAIVEVGFPVLGCRCRPVTGRKTNRVGMAG
jgi:hypothetical protein